MISVFKLTASSNGCDHLLTDPSAYLQSPHYQRIESGVQCMYAIELPWDRRIGLYWEYFDLGTGCGGGKIEVGLL